MSRCGHANKSEAAERTPADRGDTRVRHPDAGLSNWLPVGADVAETTYTPFRHTADASAVRLIVRRVEPTPGSQLALFVDYSYHAFISDRAGETLELVADHRRHAEI